MLRLACFARRRQGRGAKVVAALGRPGLRNGFTQGAGGETGLFPHQRLRAVDLSVPRGAIAAAAEKAASEKKDFERVATPKLVRALWDVAAASKVDASTRVAACRFLATCCSAVGSKVVDGPALSDAAQYVVVEDGVDCALAEALARLVRDSSRNGQKPDSVYLFFTETSLSLESGDGH